MDNYRPVYLLLQFSKILEKILVKQIEEYTSTVLFTTGHVLKMTPSTTHPCFPKQAQPEERHQMY